jgi:hypothetical protein
MKEKHALDRRDGKIGIGAVAAAVRFTAAAPTFSRAGALSHEARSDPSVCCGSQLLKQKTYVRHLNDAVTGRDRSLLLYPRKMVAECRCQGERVCATSVGRRPLRVY